MKSPERENLPAFPSVIELDQNNYIYMGMTKLELFAAHALTGLLTRGHDNEQASILAGDAAVRVMSELKKEQHP